MGAQHRPQEAPRGDQKRHQKKKIERRREEEHEERQKELQKTVTVSDPTTRVLQVKGDLSSLVARGP